MTLSPRTVLSLATAALLAAVAAPVAAQTVLTLSSWVPPAHTLSTGQIEWCEMLAQKVPGKIKCNALPRAVTAAPGTFDAVRNGLVDISFTVHGYTPGRFVMPQMVEFPFMGDSSEVTSVAFQRIYAKVPASPMSTRV
jgi:TRAP-type C4-dicarboxylate transport system substrate-binding protein